MFESVQLGQLSARWSPEKQLVLTTAHWQHICTADEVVALLEMLYHHRHAILEAASPTTTYEQKPRYHVIHERRSTMADEKEKQLGNPFEVSLKTREAMQSSGPSSDDEQAIRCAVDQVTRDIPYVEIRDAVIYRKIVNEDQKLTPGDKQLFQATGDRWDVEVELLHPEDESMASALYRVWSTPEGLKAIKVQVA